MAISKLEVGVVPLGVGGDSLRSAAAKINANFSNTSHAASREVGTKSGNLVEMTGTGFNGTGIGGENMQDAKTGSVNAIKGAGDWVTAFTDLPSGVGSFGTLSNRWLTNASILQVYTDSTGKNTIMRKLDPRDMSTSGWTKLYSDGNTTVDSNKNIKTSSPVVRVFSDHLDKIHEANDLPVKYTRNGVGDYTIEGTTGLRENDWQLVIPKDDHDNQLIAFTIEDDNGTIKLKTYKRTFSMETFTFGPDLSTPLDIPEGRWIDLHFNDLPDDSQMGV